MFRRERSQDPPSAIFPPSRPPGAARDQWPSLEKSAEAETATQPCKSPDCKSAPAWVAPETPQEANPPHIGSPYKPPPPALPAMKPVPHKTTPPAALDTLIRTPHKKNPRGGGSALAFL